MNNQIKLAVASALLAVTASANAGIIIPAGDWTLNIGGVVSAFYTVSGSTNVTPPGPLVKNPTLSNITSGFTPTTLYVSAKTRQNNLDVGFTIAINPGIATFQALDQATHQENRQAYMTIGDASWGSVKLGKDMGIFASDAMLNDMGLLGVGSSAAHATIATSGRVGYGYIYPDWKSQIAYTSPNWNGFSFTAGVTQAWNTLPIATDGPGASSTTRGGSEPAFEGKASYAWDGDVAGKVWVSAFSQKIEQLTGLAGSPARAHAVDVGANINAAGFGLTGYYYDGKGIGFYGVLLQGYSALGNQRDFDGGYVQATYTLPQLGTKLGISWGLSNFHLAAEESPIAAMISETAMWTAGVYHPLTKHINLVAEYTELKNKVHNGATGTRDHVSLGAILFF